MFTSTNTVQGARAGYPSSGRVIQAPTTGGTYAGGMTGGTYAGGTYAGGMTGATYAGVSRPATTIASSPVASAVVRSGGIAQSAAAPQTRTYSTGTTPSYTTGTTMPLTTMSSGARQARVISSGATMAPTQYLSGGQRTVISGGINGATAPRISAARPATVLGARNANTMGGPSVTQAAYEVKHKEDPQLQNLKELRKTSGLKNVPVGGALQTLKSMAIDGKLTREQFMTAYLQLLQQFQIQVPSAAVTNAVFDLFDRDDNGVVDMMELICGASLLCTGTEEDKIHAVFDVFDENGDGVISMDEMFKFLTSVFKVVLTPNVMAVMNTMGVTVESAEDLASVTALECFKTADLNHDGRLSVEEFKNWFFAPRNDPSFLFSPVRKLLQ